jgi:hypothetical protein
MIHPEIDYQLARGGTDGVRPHEPARIAALLEDRPLMIFVGCAALSHFANAAMLPLLGEMLANGKGRASMLLMSACVVTTQLTITILAAWAGAPQIRGAASPSY